MAAEEAQKPSWRQRRIEFLRGRVEDGSYWISDLEIANAILHGRPRWGDNPTILMGGDAPMSVSLGGR